MKNVTRMTRKKEACDSHWERTEAERRRCQIQSQWDSHERRSRAIQGRIRRQQLFQLMLRATDLPRHQSQFN
jgi:hypothetical protein